MSDRVVVAMSGGVDSSVAAALMKKKGFEVVGLTMELSSSSRCCSSDDVQDARRVAKALNIPHYVVSCKNAFRKNVIDYFIEEYIRGRTPNPCAVCNPKIKFGVLLDKALNLGTRMIVTGHYANVKRNPDTGRWLLERGKEVRKDQSYFLGRLSQEQLSCSAFPVGKYSKARIRQMAEKMNIPVAQKTESQEACFIPDSGVAKFIQQSRGTSFPRGKIIGTDGRELGRHSGIIGYTIGQRKGLGIALGRPVYVTEINADKNTVTVGDDHELFHRSMITTDPNWISIPALTKPTEVRTRIRYKHQPALSVIEMTDDNRVRVTFQKAQRAITPGQLAVFYQGNIVVGSAWIDGIIDKSN